MRRSIFFLILISSFSIKINAQYPVSIFNHNRDSIPNESIYLHTNQQSYLAGETIWFKAYLYADFNSSTLSSNFFIELLNENYEIIIEKKLPVFAGTAYGNFDLPDTLKEGIYLIRAYTPWTLNLGDAFVFKKGIPVFNPLKKSSLLYSAPGKYTCLFYPESGQLVNGLPNIIAYRAMNNYLQPVQITGAVTDANGNEIIGFKSDTQGMGTFSFMPEYGKNYFAKIEYADKTVKEFSLPAAADKGVLLNTGENKNGKFFYVTASGIEFNELLLLAVMQNNIVVEKKISLKNNEAQGIINTDGLPAGLLQLLLFDKNNRLLAFRNTYINHSSTEMSVQLITDSFSISKKAKNEFTLRFPDSTQGNFSLTVSDAGAGKELNNNNIHSGLLLQPGSNGLISAGSNNLKSDYWDLLALTNNWPVDLQKKEIKYRDEPYISISGKVFRELNRKVAIKDELNFIIDTKDSSRIFLSAPVSDDGSFQLSNLVYEDTAKFLYQINAKKDAAKSASIKLNVSVFNYSGLLNNDNNAAHFNTLKYVFADTAQEPQRLKEAYNYFSELSKPGRVLDEVVVKTKRLSPVKEVEKKYTNGLFRSAPGAKTVDLINEPPRSGALNIFEHLKGKIPGLQISKLRGKYVIESYRSVSIGDIVIGRKDPATGQEIKGNGFVDGKVFLNEMEVDADMIANISMSEIALVKFYPPGSIFLPGVGISCVLAIYTKQADDLKQAGVSYLNSFLYPGYSVTKIFSSPDYSKADKINQDFRTTLFWEPNLILDGSTNEFKIRFYNSDVAQKFKLVLEGITDDGRLVHFEKIIEK